MFLRLVHAKPRKDFSVCVRLSSIEAEIRYEEDTSTNHQDYAIHFDQVRTTCFTLVLDVVYHCDQTCANNHTAIQQGSELIEKRPEVIHFSAFLFQAKHNGFEQKRRNRAAGQENKCELSIVIHQFTRFLLTPPNYQTHTEVDHHYQIEYDSMCPAVQSLPEV